MDIGKWPMYRIFSHGTFTGRHMGSWPQVNILLRWTPLIYVICEVLVCFSPISVAQFMDISTEEANVDFNIGLSFVNFCIEVTERNRLDCDK